MDLRIGCSGFLNNDWKDIFYPTGLSRKNWLPFYCERFNTVEINSTFYRTPSEKTLNTWFEQTPENFLFTIKAPRTITHYKKFSDTISLTKDFYLLIQDCLKEKLGCVLFQMPPSFSFTKERLYAIIRNLSPEFVNVVEFRHISWWNTEVYSELTKHRIVFSGQSHPSPLPGTLIKNNDIFYYRFHGDPILYKSTYPEKTIQAFYNELPKECVRAFVYFNNTWGTGALINAEQLQRLSG